MTPSSRRSTSRATRRSCSGSARTVDWETGQPNTDAGFIACSFIQVVYGGINLTTPTACAQTTYS